MFSLAHGGADPRFPFLFTGKRREAAQVRCLVYVDPQGRLDGGGKREREKKERRDRSCFHRSNSPLLLPSSSLFSQDATASGSDSGESDSDWEEVCVRERERKNKERRDRSSFPRSTPPPLLFPLFTGRHRLGVRLCGLGLRRDEGVCARERERKGGGRIDLVFTVLTPPPSPSPLLHSAPPAAGPPAPPPARSPPRRSTSTRSSRRRSRPRRTRSWTTSSTKGST